MLGAEVGLASRTAASRVGGVSAEAAAGASSGRALHAEPSSISPQINTFCSPDQRIAQLRNGSAVKLAINVRDVASVLEIMPTSTRPSSEPKKTPPPPSPAHAAAPDVVMYPSDEERTPAWIMASAALTRPSKFRTAPSRHPYPTSVIIVPGEGSWRTMRSRRVTGSGRSVLQSARSALATAG